MTKKNAFPSQDSIKMIELMNDVQKEIFSVDSSKIEVIANKISSHEILKLPNGVNMIATMVISAFKYIPKTRDSIIPLVKHLTKIQDFKTSLLERSFAFDCVYVTFSANRGSLLLIARLIDSQIIDIKDIIPYLKHYTHLADDHYPQAALVYYIFAPEISTDAELKSEFETVEDFIHKNNLYDFHFQKVHEVFNLLQDNSWSLLKKYRNQGFMDMSTEAIIHNDAVGALEYIENADEPIECSIFEPSPFLENRPNVIMFAAFYGSNQIFEHLIAKSDVNQQNNEGYTIANFAAAGGHLNIVKKLHEKKADFKGCLQLSILNHQKDVADFLVNEVKIPLTNAHPRFSTPLVSSVFSDDLDVFLQFAKKEKAVDANAKDKTFMTMLHQAAGHGSICILSALMTFPNVNINAKDKNESTPLIEAVSRSQILTASVILQNEKADVNAKDKRMQAAIHIAATNGDTDIAVMLASDKRCDANAGNRLGNTALILSLESKHTKTAIALTECESVKVDARNTLCVAPIHVAVERNYLDVVNVLIAKGTDVNVLTKKGKKAPLHTACELGLDDIIKVLLEQKTIKVNIKNSEGWTPLHYACEYNHFAAVKTLIAAGANINALNIGNETPLHFSLQIQDSTIADYLLGLKDIAVKQASVEGWTCLHFAANQGFFQTCARLIEMYPEAINAVTSKGKTPLFCAAQTGKDDVMRLLIEHGADPAFKDIEEKTPLHYAAENGHTEAMRILMQSKNVDINATAFENLTPLHMAAMYNRVDALKLLLSRKEIKPNCATEDGTTPYKYAVLAHADECLAVLKLDERVKQTD